MPFARRTRRTRRFKGGDGCADHAASVGESFTLQQGGRRRRRKRSAKKSHKKHHKKSHKKKRKSRSRRRRRR